MGELQHQLTGRRWPLPARLIIGRSEGSDLRLEDARASGEHASLYFDEGFWVVRDLASRNGTQINGAPLVSGGRRVLELGDVLSFGSESESYKLTDDEPPPEKNISPTVQATFDLEDMSLEFQERSGEPVRITVVTASLRIEAPSRAFHELLLLLAKARSDSPSSIPEEDRGWVSSTELIGTLYPDSETLNVNLYRARRQFVELGVRDARNLIERKPGARLLRLGLGALTFV